MYKISYYHLIRQTKHVIKFKHFLSILSSENGYHHCIIWDCPSAFECMTLTRLAGRLTAMLQSILYTYINVHIYTYNNIHMYIHYSKHRYTFFVFFVIKSLIIIFYTLMHYILHKKYVCNKIGNFVYVSNNFFVIILPSM